MKVLSTKILDAPTLDYAKGLGLLVDCVELIETRPVEFETDEVYKGFDAVAFTSAAAVKYFFVKNGAREFLTGKIIYSTSGKTKTELANAGVAPMEVADNASALGDLIAANPQIKSMLHICGNLRLPELENKIIAARKTYQALIVYETILKNNFVQKGEYDVVMFYSPSGVNAYCANNELNIESAYCCIGETTASVVKSKKGNLKVLISPGPSPKDMVELIATTFDFEIKKKTA